MTYKNVLLQSTEPPLFSYRLITMGGSVMEKGFTTSDEAAWAADKARFILRDYIRRSREFNFPDRIAAASEGELSSLSAPVEKMLVACRSAFPEIEREPKAVEESLRRQLDAVIGELNISDKALLDLETALTAVYSYRSMRPGVTRKAQRVEEMLREFRNSETDYRSEHVAALFRLDAEAKATAMVEPRLPDVTEPRPSADVFDVVGEVTTDTLVPDETVPVVPACPTPEEIAALPIGETPAQ